MNRPANLDRESMLIWLARWQGRADQAKSWMKQKDPNNEKPEIRMEVSDFAEMLEVMTDFVKGTS